VQEPLSSPGSLLASFVSENRPSRLVLVSGHSGAGKTTWCLSLAGEASSRQISYCGLVSPAVFEEGIKVGIDLRDLQSGSQRRLAVRRNVADKSQVTEGWLVNDETLIWGNGLVSHPARCSLLILDELGPLELKHGVGLMNGMDLVTSRVFPLACVVIRPALLSLALAHWPWGEILHIPQADHKGVNGL
jgi:nucleoside-triphosphatase THEP1